MAWGRGSPSLGFWLLLLYDGDDVFSQCSRLGPLLSLEGRTSPGEGGLERKGIHLSFHLSFLLPTFPPAATFYCARYHVRCRGHSSEQDRQRLVFRELQLGDQRPGKLNPVRNQVTGQGDHRKSSGPSAMTLRTSPGGDRIGGATAQALGSPRTQCFFKDASKASLTYPWFHRDFPKAHCLPGTVLGPGEVSRRTCGKASPS